MRKYSFENTDNKYFYEGDLGVKLLENSTQFAVWSPYAQSVCVNLYADCTSPKPLKTLPMSRKNGVWSCEIPERLDGIYYTYSITHEGKCEETIDIYARSCGTNGLRGMIFDSKDTDPDGWENEKPIKFHNKTDAIIYELHVRDFSSDISGNFVNRGKFLAFCEENRTNSHSDIIGLDYIKNLGATHIHLLPVADFASVDENNPQFNWGYDPLNYNIPEGSYSTNPSDGKVRVRELKQLVSAAHKKGLGIILDVVYNHTYQSFDSPFFRTFPYYFYRSFKGKLSNGSGCGNELASERKMASRFIVDSLCYLAEEYKLDGFRFDLMGLLDIETLNAAAARLLKINPCIILYGEGWTGGNSPQPEQLRAVKKNAVKLPEFAMFSDNFRDSVKGSVFNDKDSGYINGSAERLRENIKSAIAGGVYHPEIQNKNCWTDNPAQVINYVEAHDNLTFADKLSVSLPDVEEEYKKRVNKLGAALVFLSQGVPFIQAGQEILRSKYDSETGEFIHDSYKSPDRINSIKWDDIHNNADILEYYKGLISIRKKFPQFRLKSGEEIRRLLHFTDLKNGAMVVNIAEFSLYINPSDNIMSFTADRNFTVFADGEKASSSELYKLKKDEKFHVMPKSILLLK